MKLGDVQTGYVRVLADWIAEIETRLTDLYGRNWTLRIERESPGVWRCHWDTLTENGEVIRGGSESFTISEGVLQ